MVTEKKPPLLQRLESQLEKKGMPEERAAAVALRTLRATGSIEPSSLSLTKRGEERQEMGAAGRAIDRAATESGRPASEYVYSSKTNRATLKGR